MSSYDCNNCDIPCSTKDGCVYIGTSVVNKSIIFVKIKCVCSCVCVCDSARSRSAPPPPTLVKTGFMLYLQTLSMKGLLMNPAVFACLVDEIAVCMVNNRKRGHYLTTYIFLSRALILCLHQTVIAICPMHSKFKSVSRRLNN